MTNANRVAQVAHNMENDFTNRDFIQSNWITNLVVQIQIVLVHLSVRMIPDIQTIPTSEKVVPISSIKKVNISHKIPLIKINKL